MKKKYFWILCVLIILGLGGGWGFIKAAAWLAPAEPAQKAEVIICLNGEERVRKAAELYHRGLASRIILTAGRHQRDLTRLGVPEKAVLWIPWPRTTYQEALAVAPIIEQEKYRSALVVSDPYHLRRVRWTFHQVLKDQPIRLTFVETDLKWTQQGWWQEGKSRVYVLSELSKLSYYWVAHGLLGLADDPPWTIELKHHYQRWLTRVLNGD